MKMVLVSVFISAAVGVAVGLVMGSVNSSANKFGDKSVSSNVMTVAGRSIQDSNSTRIWITERGDGTGVDVFHMGESMPQPAGNVRITGVFVRIHQINDTQFIRVYEGCRFERMTD